MRMWVWIMALGVFAMGVTACRGSEGSDGWRGVSVDGAVLTHLQLDSWLEVVVAGRSAGGRTFVASVDPSRGQPVGPVYSAELDGEGAVTSLAAAGGEAMVTTAHGDGSTRVWWGAVPDLDPDSIMDEAGQQPGRAWVAFSDEQYHVVGQMVDEAGRSILLPLSGESGVWLMGHQELFIHPSADAEQILLTGDEANMAVVGPVTADPNVSTVGVQMWTTHDEADGWWPIPLEVQVAAVTDGRGWALAFWVAGYTPDRRPVVFDDAGRSVPVPDVKLDAQHPAVFIADVGTKESDLVVAMQTVDGPRLYFPTDGDGWRAISAPSGNLSGAVVAGDRDGNKALYVIVDGALWWKWLESNE